MNATAEPRGTPCLDVADVGLPGSEARDERTQGFDDGATGAKLFGVVNDRIRREARGEVCVQVMRTEDHIGRIAEEFVAGESDIVTQPAQCEGHRPRDAEKRRVVDVVFRLDDQQIELPRHAMQFSRLSAAATLWRNRRAR